jgi:hypothetical protein
MGAAITITNLDPVTLDRLESEARRRGVDVGTVAAELLRASVPPVVSPATNGQTHHDLDALAGTWSDDEARSFDTAVADLGRVDGDLWK